MATQSVKKKTTEEIIKELRRAEKGRLPVLLETKKGDAYGRVELLSSKVVDLAVDMKKNPEAVLLTRDDQSFSFVALRSITDLNLGSPEPIVCEPVAHW